MTDAVFSFPDAFVVRALRLAHPAKTRPHHLPTVRAQLPRQGKRHDMARAAAQQGLRVADQHQPLGRPGRAVDQQLDLAGRAVDEQWVTCGIRHRSYPCKPKFGAHSRRLSRDAAHHQQHQHETGQRQCRQRGQRRQQGRNHQAMRQRPDQAGRMSAHAGGSLKERAHGVP